MQLRKHLLGSVVPVLALLASICVPFGARAQGTRGMPFSGTGVETLMGGGAAGSEHPAREQSDSSKWIPVKPSGKKSSSSSEKPRHKARREGKERKKKEQVQKAETQAPKERAKPEKPAPARVEPPKRAQVALRALKEARALAKEGKHAEALEAFKKSLKEAVAEKDRKITAAALGGMARASFELGDYEEALGYLKRSIKLHQELKNARARSLDYLLAGRILMDQGTFGSALKYFQESLQILPDSEAAQRPRLLEDLASCQLRLNRYSAAVSTYGHLLSLLRKKGDKKNSARVLVQLGELQVSRSEFRAAGSTFKRAGDLYRELGLKKELGETLFRQAYLDMMAGRLEAARKAMKEGRALLAGRSTGESQALPLVVRGMTAHDEGNPVEAVKLLTRALAKYRDGGNRLMAARVRLALGTVECDRSRFQSALEHGGKALKEFRSLSDPGGEAGALQLVAKTYFRLGFAQKALEYAQESLAVAKRINDKVRRTEARLLLARIHTSLGDVDFAGKLLRESLEDMAEGLGRRTKGRVHLAVARFRLARQDSDRALVAAAAALKNFKAAGDRRGIADCAHLIGKVYELRGEFEKARKRFELALKSHRRMWDRYGEGADLTALGVHYKNLGRYDKAVAYFKDALDLRRRISDRRGEASSLANMGNLLKHRGQAPEALKNLESALKICRELGDKRGEADILTSLGNVHTMGRSYALALEKLNSALELHREIHDTRGVATDLASLGRLHLLRGESDQARANLEEAAKINRRIKNPRGTVAILAEQAMLKRSEKAPSQALALLERALKLARNTGDTRAVSSLNLKMAAVLKDGGHYKEALSLLRETLDMMRKQHDRRGEFWALGELGMIQAKTEDYENALTSLHRAEELRTELGLPSSQSRELDFTLGEIYEGFKDFEQALEHYHRALALAQITGTNHVLGRIYDRIGNIYYQIEDYGKARESYEDALRLHSEAGNSDMRKKELIRLGDVFSKLGDSEAALRYQLKALNLTRETGDEKTEARILTRIGTLYQMLGRPRTALEQYRLAAEKRNRLGDRRGVSENLLQIALVTSILGHFDQAVENLKEAFKIAHCSEDRRMLWKAYFIMGRTLQGRKRLGEALESYRKAITILEAMEVNAGEESDDDNFIFGGKTALFETTLKVLMILARKDPQGAYDNQALRIVEKLKAAEFENVLSQTNVQSFADLPPDLLIKEKSLRLSLRKLNGRLSEELSKIHPDQGLIKKLLAERRAKEQAFVKLKARLVKEFPAYAALRYPRPVSVHQFQKETLLPDEAVLAYMVTRSRTYLFAIDKTRFYTYSIDYPRDHLQRDVDALIRPLYRAETLESWDPSVAYRMYSRLIQPVEYFLAGKKSVVIVPHGPIASLPFEMLISSHAHAKKRFWSVSDRPTYLVEKYAFSYVPTVSGLSFLRKRARPNKPGWTIAAFGDAVYTDKGADREVNPGAEKLLAAFGDSPEGSRGRGLKPLPRTREEISEIVKIMGGPTQTYLGSQATETLFKKVDLSRYSYIHLATHGLILNSVGKLWQQPAIVFSLYGDTENDGFLQLGEVFGLKLNADLVVLSSCLSPSKGGAGNPKGLLGLTRAFFFAGADSIILSMWEVNDASTAKLFIEMYRNLKTKSKSEALREAQITLLKSPTTSHPYYWAPFVLMGKWQVKYRPGSNKMDPKEMRFKGLSTWRRFLSL
jgi:tetratricopeptide (TPR) repeat protein/CHAT domain-containing protein